MSPLAIFLTMALAFHLGVGIGTTIKYYAEVGVKDAVKFICVLPFQVLIMAIMAFFEVTPKMTRKNPRLRHKATAILASFNACIHFLPVFASVIASSTIRKKSKILNVIRFIKDDCIGAVEYALQH